MNIQIYMIVLCCIVIRLEHLMSHYDTNTTINETYRQTQPHSHHSFVWINQYMSNDNKAYYSDHLLTRRAMMFLLE